MSRFDLEYSAGTLPHDLMTTTIELYGRKVMPLVREHIVEPDSTAATSERRV